MKVLLTIGLLTLSAFTVQESMQPTNELEQHAWLQQLVGEWKVSSEAIMEPGGEPMTWESEESVRSIGGLWIVAEGTAEHDGQPFTSLMTLGYDPNKESFVGSWVDTLQTTMWTYVGQLDESKRVLTLEAEGPSFDDPTKTARYRDQLELISSDRRRMKSAVLQADGSWMSFLTVEARRAE